MKVRTMKSAERFVLEVLLVILLLGCGDEQIKLGGRELQIYLTVHRVCPKLSFDAVSGWIGVSGMHPTLHQRGCSLTISRGHYLVVLASSMNIPRNELIRGVGFSPWEDKFNVNLS